MRTRGTWWLPGRESDGVGGELVVSPDEFALELDGTLRSGEPIDESLFEEDRDLPLTPTRVEHPIVHGRSREAGRFTLLDVQSESLFGPLQEHLTVLHSTWRVSGFLRGEHLEPEDLSFDRARITLDYLEDWVGPGPLSISHQRNPTGIAVTGTTREVDTAHVDDTTTKLLDIATSRVRAREVEVSLQLALEVVLQAPVPWRDVTEIWAAPLRDLLSFATLRPNRTVGLRVRRAAQAEALPWCELNVRTLDWQREERAERRRLEFEQLFTLADVDGGLASLLPRWYDLRSDFEPVLSLLLGVDYALFMYGQQRFLALIQAAEILHTTKFGGNPIPKDDHRARVDEVMQANIPEAHRDWVKKTLNQDNWLRLSDRLTQLCERCNPLVDAMRQRRSSIEALVRALARTRNALTHEGPSSTTDLDASGMFWATRLLAWLIRYHLLDTLGFDEPRRRTLVERNPDFERSLEATIDHL